MCDPIINGPSKYCNCSSQCHNTGHLKEVENPNTYTRAHTLTHKKSYFSGHHHHLLLSSFIASEQTSVDGVEVASCFGSLFSNLFWSQGTFFFT